MVYVARTENFDPQDAANPIETVTIVDGLNSTVQVKKDIEIAGVEKMSVSGATVYDQLGRAIKQYHPLMEDKVTFNFFDNFDINNNLSPYFSTTSYDVYDRPVTSVDEDGHATNMAYLINNDRYKTTVTQMQNATTQLQSQILKDADGRTIKTSSFMGNTPLETMFTYNTIGELKTVTDPEGLVTYYDYDLAGRKVSINHPDHGVSEFAYDKAGNLTGNHNANGGFINYAYNYNRLINIIYPDTPNGTNPANVTYKYAPSGSGNNSGKLISDDEFNLVIEIPPTQYPNLFKTQGYVPSSKKIMFYEDGNRWSDFYKKEIGRGDTIVKKRGN